MQTSCRIFRIPDHDADHKRVIGVDVPSKGEAGVTRWWGQYGCVAALGVDSFGESAPGARLYEHFGLTARRVAEEVTSCVKSRRALA